MRRCITAFCALLLCCVLLPGCSADEVYQDGQYTAQFKEYDSYGYKEYLTATVAGGEVTELVYNAVDEDGGLRTEDEKYRQNMESAVDNYPEKYTKDLVNQLLETQDIEAVDNVAGATWSSHSFKALYTALEVQMLAGNTATTLVDNVPEK